MAALFCYLPYQKAINMAFQGTIITKIAFDRILIKQLKSISNNQEQNMKLFHFFAEIWLQKCKHLVCKSQSKLSSSIPIGSYMLNVYIFDVKFLQKIETVSYLILGFLIWTLILAKFHYDWVKILRQCNFLNYYSVAISSCFQIIF